MTTTTIILLLTVALLTMEVKSADDSCKPQQIHLSLSDAFTYSNTTKNTMRVIFHTQEECSGAYISLKDSQGNLQKIQATAVNLFTDKYTSGTYSTYIHIFDFLELDFSSIYEYSCYGTDDGSFLPNFQGPYKFYVPSPNTDNSQQQTQVVMFADMDHSPEGMPTVNKLAEIAQNNLTEISAFIHYGDMAYNLQRNTGKFGDDYMNTVESFAATMPYMVSAGNHEVFRNFSLFNMRFQMPNFDQSQNHYYSYNVGNMHFVSFNLDLVIEYPNLKRSMLVWLEQDLQKANETRDKQPWIIAYTHRPFYCSFGNDPDCNNNYKIYSEFEDLLVKYNVDLVAAGHVHFYERMLPIKKGKIAPFQLIQDDKNFNQIINPQGPIHILQGMAGHRGDFADPKDAYRGKSWTVKVSKAYSFLSVKSSNNTHLLVENFESKSGNVNDYFYVIKNKSEFYARLPADNTPSPDLNAASHIRSSLLALILICIALFV